MVYYQCKPQTRLLLLTLTLAPCPLNSAEEHSETLNRACKLNLLQLLKTVTVISNIPLDLRDVGHTEDILKMLSSLTSTVL